MTERFTGIAHCLYSNGYLEIHICGIYMYICICANRHLTECVYVDICMHTLHICMCHVYIGAYMHAFVLA